MSAFIRHLISIEKLFYLGHAEHHPQIESDKHFVRNAIRISGNVFRITGEDSTSPLSMVRTTLHGVLYVVPSSDLVPSPDLVLISDLPSIANTTNGAGMPRPGAEIRASKALVVIGVEMIQPRVLRTDE